MEELNRHFLDTQLNHAYKVFFYSFQQKSIEIISEYKSLGSCGLKTVCPILDPDKAASEIQNIFDEVIFPSKFSALVAESSTQDLKVLNQEVREISKSAKRRIQPFQELLRLIKYIEKVRSEFVVFYETNDSAHQIDHADAVAYNAVKILEWMRNKGFAVKSHITGMAIIAAYAHDVFSKTDLAIRKVHHEKAYEFVLQRGVGCLESLNGDELLDVALACREHRASWKGEYSNLLSEIVASADRGKPNLDDYLYRAFQYGMDVYGHSLLTAPLRALFHINYKFGSNFTANVPTLWKEIYENEIIDLRKDLSEMCRRMTPELGIRVTKPDDDHQWNYCDIDVDKEILMTDPNSIYHYLRNQLIPKYKGRVFSKMLEEEWLPLF